MVGRTQQLAARATGHSNKHVPVSSFTSNTMRSFACLCKLTARVSAPAPQVRVCTKSMEQYSSARVSAPAPVQVCGREYDDLAHSCNALRRASARPLPRHERLQNRGINAFQRCKYTLDCIRNKPSALSHSEVHLMTHDVQLPAMMCNYTFYTCKIN